MQERHPMVSKQPPRFRVAEHSELSTRIEDRSGNIAAIVLTGNLLDAHQMAAAPDLYDRLTEVRHLRRSTGNGGRQEPLLPPDALAAIDNTLRQARGETL